MKKIFTLLILFCASVTFAQNYKTGSITGTTCFGIDTTNAGTVGISVQNSSTGSAWTGTIQPSASIGGDPAANISVTPAGSSTAQSTITANGVYYAAISGSTYVQVCGNTVTNTAAIKLFPAQYSKNFGSGGTGTVGAGTANQFAFYSSTGTTVIGNTHLTDNGTTVASSEPIAAPTGGSTSLSNNSYQYVGDGTSGLFYEGAHSHSIVVGGIRHIFFQNSPGEALINVPACDFATGNNCLTWAAGLISTTGSGNPLLYANNGCHVTADITLTVATPITICTWSLPAVAKAWAWSCPNIPWILSAGTGTNTLSIIANPSQTPTGTTNGSAEIKTTNTNTATELTTPISASGGTTLLTSPTLTPTATIFSSSTSGTLLASATAGTFSIQMMMAGTTATALAKAGANCWLY